MRRCGNLSESWWKATAQRMSDVQIGGVGREDPSRQARVDLNRTARVKDEHLPGRRVETGIVEDHAAVGAQHRLADQGGAAIVAGADLVVGNIMPAFVLAPLAAGRGRRCPRPHA